MGFEEALSFSAAAPFIAMLIGLIKSVVDIPKRWIPLIAVGLAFAWGGILVVSDVDVGNVAQFVVTATTVGVAASGLQSIARTIDNTSLRIGPNANRRN